MADITYVSTAQGWVYVAAILDLYSRRIVGWAMATHLQTELVLAALEMARVQRRPAGVIHHSDHGTQYTSLAFGERCRVLGVRPSRGTVGDCYDNAVMESFFKTLKVECVYQQKYATRQQAISSIFRFIECWYNKRRRHSSLGYLSPEAYEASLNSR